MQETGFESESVKSKDERKERILGCMLEYIKDSDYEVYDPCFEACKYYLFFPFVALSLYEECSLQQATLL